MTSAIYAGSFDPWSIGHEAVLNSALDIFSQVHVLVAVNPSKQGTIDPLARARIIASAIDPCTNWWACETPFHLGENVVIATTPGLVVEYASSHGIKNLVRGLRSTTDFEAEFNLYFSNRTIDSRIQTWAVLCPPELLHCSSTYVRSVVGNPNAKRVGATFVAQSMMLGTPLLLGRMFDFIVYASRDRFESEGADLDTSHLKSSLQGLFTTLIRSEDKMRKWRKNEADLGLDEFMIKNKSALAAAHELHEYPRDIVQSAWVQVAAGITENPKSSRTVTQAIHLLSTLSGPLGRSHRPLFDALSAEELIREL